MGKSEAARTHFLEFRKKAEQWMDEYPDDPGSYIVMGVVLTHLGEIETGWEIGKQAIQLDSTFHIRFAELLAAQDKKSKALDHLEKALVNGYCNLAWLRLSSDLQPLHKEDRFKDLINKFFIF